MLQLKNELYKSLTYILEDIPTNTQFIRSVLEGHVDGKIFVDREINPSSIYICHKYGMTFLYGDSGNDLFNSQLAEYFRSIKQDEWIQTYPQAWDSFLRSLTESAGVEFYSRVNFAFDQKIFEKNTRHASFDNCTVQEATVDIMKNFNGKVVPKYFWKEFLLPSCKGYVAMVENEPASIAFSAYLHGSDLEIGIETAEKHRGSGLAFAACVALIRYCIEKGMTPIWSCKLDNTASMKLAQRLGFVEIVRFPYYCIPAKDCE